MKTVICLLAIVACATAIEIETYSIANSLVDLLESLRDEMPCGFPLLGIPPLAPFVVDFKTVDINTPSLKVLGVVENFTAIDLNSYEVLNVKNNPIKRKLTFSLYFKNIEVDTGYDLRSHFEQYGWTVKVIGTGKANFAVKGLLVSVTAKYNINVINSRIKLKSLRIVPHIESVVSNIEGILGHGPVNRKWNQALESRVPAFVNTFAEYIANQLEAIVMPRVNKFLYQYNLHDILGGIGGNEDGNFEKIKCEL